MVDLLIFAVSLTSYIIKFQYFLSLAVAHHMLMCSFLCCNSLWLECPFSFIMDWRWAYIFCFSLYNAKQKCYSSVHSRYDIALSSYHVLLDPFPHPISSHLHTAHHASTYLVFILSTGEALLDLGYDIRNDTQDLGFDGISLLFHVLKVIYFFNPFRF